MTPTAILEEKAAQLLAADTATLAQAADNNVVILVTGNFNETGNLVAADLEEADFDGYAALLCGLGTQPEGLDPATGDYIIDFEAPAGGWRFECTADPEEPVEITGFALVNEAKTTLWAAHKFADPIVINRANQQINLADMVRLTFTKGFVS